MRTHRFFSCMAVLALRSIASLGFLLCLCYGATGQILFSLTSALVAVIAVFCVHKLEPPVPSRKRRKR